MKYARMLLSSLILLGGGGARADSGGWSGNGGEPQRMAENVWFVNQDVIPYCVQVADRYPFSKDQLRGLIQDSFQDWRTFFQLYGIDGQSKAAAPKAPPMAKPAVSMSLNFVETDCSASGPGLQGERLRFLFGLSNPLVDAYRAFNPEEPLGAAMKKAEDGSGLHNYGTIWIDQFTSETAKIKHLLLHEIGHVLGMPHNSVFVMNQDVVDDLQQADVQSLGAVESPFWPYRLREKNTVDLSLIGFVRPKALETRPHKVCDKQEVVSHGLLHDLGLAPDDCYDLALSTQRIDAGRISVQLILTGARQTVSLHGEFRPFPLADMLPKGPKFQAFQSDIQKWNSWIFDPAAALDSWQGEFIRTGQPIAAQLFMIKGIALHLHLPSVNEWVMLKSNAKQ